MEIGGRLLVDDASFTIMPRDKVGLVGRNGAGKTTFFKTLGGELEPEAVDREQFVGEQLPVAHVADQIDVRVDDPLLGNPIEALDALDDTVGSHATTLNRPLVGFNRWDERHAL